MGSGGTLLVLIAAADASSRDEKRVPMSTPCLIGSIRASMDGNKASGVVVRVSGFSSGLSGSPGTGAANLLLL